MHFKDINNGSPRITRPSSRSRIYVRTAGSIFRLPAALPTCSFTKGSAVLTPCPLAQDTLACSLHLVSDPWARKTLPKTWVAGSYTHFSPQRKLPETWIHSEGVTMPCPGYRHLCKNVRILSGEYSYPMSKG